MSELIIQDKFETDQDFKERKKTTLNLLSYDINLMTAIVLGRMIITKKLGVTYDDDIETIITKFNL